MPATTAAIRLIVNPAAGGGKARRLAPEAETALRALGLSVRRDDTRDLAHARTLALEAARGREVVVVLSGDGAIGAIADALRSVPGAVLGVLPGGRGNDLARVLGISDDLREACAVIAAGAQRAIDVGEVFDRPVDADAGAARDAAADASHDDDAARAGGSGRGFVGIASVGFDSEANRIANEAPAWLGGLVYAYGALRALASWRPARFELELDPPGERRSFLAYTIGTCNSKAYGGGMLAAPDAMLDDGLLEVIVLESIGKLAFLRKILPKVFKGTHVHEPSVHVFRAREVAISADRPFTMYADGDPIGELPLRVRAVAGAVNVLVPEHGPARSAFSVARSPDGR